MGYRHKTAECDATVRDGSSTTGLRAAAPRAKKIAVGSVRKTLTSTARARGDASP